MVCCRFPDVFLYRLAYFLGTLQLVVGLVFLLVCVPCFPGSCSATCFKGMSWLMTDDRDRTKKALHSRTTLSTLLAIDGRLSQSMASGHKRYLWINPPLGAPFFYTPIDIYAKNVQMQISYDRGWGSILQAPAASEVDHLDRELADQADRKRRLLDAGDCHHCVGVNVAGSPVQ